MTYFIKNAVISVNTIPDHFIKIRRLNKSIYCDIIYIHNNARSLFGLKMTIKKNLKTVNKNTKNE